MVKKAQFKPLKDAAVPFVGTIRNITTSKTLSKSLCKLLNDNQVVVVKFDYSEYGTHILLRNACEELGVPCACPQNDPRNTLTCARMAYRPPRDPALTFSSHMQACTTRMRQLLPT